MSVKVVRVMSMEEDFKLQVQKLELNDGDVLLVRVDQRVNDAMAKNLSESFKKMIGDRKVQAMLLEEDIDVTKLDERDMRELGWVRVNPALIEKSRYPYIIKSRSISEASIIAHERGLKRKEWKYMPASGIMHNLDGITTTRDKLIGDFTDGEVLHLTRYTELDSPSDAPKGTVEA